VLAALYDRERTGEGALVDVAMLDSQLAIQEHAVAIASATGVAPGPTGARHPTITPFATYRAADGFVVIAAGNDAMFAQAVQCWAWTSPADPALPPMPRAARTTPC
jgi:CoA:oxalate CoA-transferase